MFHLTQTLNISKIFEGFCVLKRNEEVKCLYSFPSNYSFQRFYDLIFPCNCPKEKSEEYCIITSNVSNDRSFLLCRYIESYKVYLCIYSHNPWFEILSKLLFNLSHDDFMPIKYNRICCYLQSIMEITADSYISLPPCKANNNIAQIILKCSIQYPYMYDKYIQEYLTAIKPTSEYKKQLWLEIFWSMLLERPIIFMSKRYQKLTSSLLAATFFIHPLSWLHKFISIIPQKNPQLLGMNCCMLGIHSCMEPILGDTDFWNEALLVDLDKGDSYMVGESENKKETQSRFKIPKYIKNFFINHIQMVDDSVSSNSSFKIKDLISNVSLSKDEEERMYNDYKKGFHIYPLLFRTIIFMLLGNYRQFIYPIKFGFDFDKDKFIQSNPKLTEFLKIFVQSQCFDSFIEIKLKCAGDGQDMKDRFDREIKEFTFKTKVSLTKVKQKKLKIHKKKIDNKPTFQARSLSLSSSGSSFNSKTNLSQDNLDDDVSNNSDSLTNQIRKGLAEKYPITYRNQPCTMHNDSSNFMLRSKEISIPPKRDKSTTLPLNLDDCIPSKPNNQVTYMKPLRPLFKPGEAPVGKVQNLIKQINHGNLEGDCINSNRKKSAPQIKPSELPPNSKPVAHLVSRFEQKPVL